MDKGEKITGLILVIIILISISGLIFFSHRSNVILETQDLGKILKVTRSKTFMERPRTKIETEKGTFIILGEVSYIKETTAKIIYTQNQIKWFVINGKRHRLLGM